MTTHQHAKCYPVRRLVSGQTVVEFALILPVFLLLAALLIDLSIYYYIEGQLSHGVRASLRDAVVGQHHRNLTGTETPREKLISIVKEHSNSGWNLIDLKANLLSEQPDDTITFVPADAYNSNRDITITVRQAHSFITPLGSLMRHLNSSSEPGTDWNIVVSTTYRSEIFPEADPP